MAERISQVLDSSLAGAPGEVVPDDTFDAAPLAEAVAGVADAYILSKVGNELGEVEDAEKGYYSEWVGAIEGARYAKDPETFAGYYTQIKRISAGEREGVLTPYSAQVRADAITREYINRYPHLATEFRDALSASRGMSVDRQKMLTEDPLLKADMELITEASKLGVTPQELSYRKNLKDAAETDMAVFNRDMKYGEVLGASPSFRAELNRYFVGDINRAFGNLQRGLLTGRMIEEGPDGEMRTIEIPRFDSLQMAQSKGAVEAFISDYRVAARNQMRLKIDAMYAQAGAVVDKAVLEQWLGEVDEMYDVLVASVKSARSESDFTQAVSREMDAIRLRQVKMFIDMVGEDVAAYEFNVPGSYTATQNLIHKTLDLGQSDGRAFQRSMTLLNQRAQAGDYNAAIALRSITGQKMFDASTRFLVPSLKGDLTQIPSLPTGPDPDSLATREAARVAALEVLKDADPGSIGARQGAAWQLFDIVQVDAGKNPMSDVNGLLSNPALANAVTSSNGAKTEVGKQFTQRIVNSASDWANQYFSDDPMLGYSKTDAIMSNWKDSAGGRQLLEPTSGGVDRVQGQRRESPQTAIYNQFANNVNRTYQILLTRDPAAAAQYKAGIMSLKSMRQAEVEASRENAPAPTTPQGRPSPLGSRVIEVTPEQLEAEFGNAKPD